MPTRPPRARRRSPRGANRGTVATAALVVGLAAAVLAGCGDDDTAPTTTVDPATTAPTDDPDATTTTVPPPTTDDAGAPTTDPTRPRCPDDDPLAGVEVAEVLGDLDGDGGPDRVAVGRTGDEWRVAVHLARGGVASGTVPDAGGPVEVAPLGVVELGPDGPVLIVRTGAGAAALVVGLHRLDGCEVTAVRLGPDPARFAIGATVTRADGLACDTDRARLVTRSAESLDGLEFDVTTTDYELVGDELVERTRTTATVRADEPEFERVAALDCGDAVLG